MDPPTSHPEIKTRFLILSDTHGHEIPSEYSLQQADVAIHCGDLTTESKIKEFRSAIKLLQTIKAPLKLVIAGNHDFTLDIPMFQRKVADVNPPLDPQLVKREYGDYGEARELFNHPQTKQNGIVFLDEGTHHFTLQNGASLKVYASPYTPSLGDWGFQYHPETGHGFDISNDVDVVISHGPPRGIMDTTNSGGRAGCPKLFEAIARSRPRMHCFGHIHEGWGEKLVGWRRNISEKPSHLTDIDNGRSTVLGKLSQVSPGTRILETSLCAGSPNPLQTRSQTLFVNAAIEGTEEFPVQPLCLVDLELPSTA
ncbi:Metallo-dependent phosphatase-like protein [Aspergillus varians]